MFACKCLNVLIHAKNNDIQKVELESLQLSDAEKNDPFFRKEFGGVIVETITKQQAGLVLTRPIGLWVVQKCLNCSLDTHAVHRDKGASCVLVAAHLQSGTSKISALRNSENFSSTFGLLINPTFTDEQTESKLTGNIKISQLPDNLQLAVSGLQQQLAEVLRREVAATEDRVRRFTEIQYANLESFRDQVHKEHHALVRLVLNSQPSLDMTKLENSAMSSLPSYQAAKAANDFEARSAGEAEIQAVSPRHPIGKPKHPIVTNLTSKTRRTTPRQLSHPISKMESDGILFPMDGMDESPGLAHSDVEESDTDDSASHDEGIHIPRQRAQSVSIAKSLPMNIPVFMSAFTHDIVDDRDDFKSKEEVDIAASIKALAKSVHGDDVFGDLPRPRFSTQI